MAEKYVTVLDSDKRTPDMKQWAKTNDRKTHKLLMKRVTSIAANNECADCTAKRPGWAALPHGIHICIHCAQIHRRIGRHISQVKAINTGTYLWCRDEYECMVKMGNANARRLYLQGAPPKPRSTDPVEKKEAYIRDVYEHHKYLNPRFKLTQSTSVNKSAKKPVKHQKSDTEEENMTPLIDFFQINNAATTTTPPLRKQPATYNDATVPDDNKEVDFFAVFDMKPTAPQASNNSVATSCGGTDDFSDILSLYRN